MSQLGLRVKEAVNIRVEHFVAKNGGLQLNIPDKKGQELPREGDFVRLTYQMILSSRYRAFNRERTNR